MPLRRKILDFALNEMMPTKKIAQQNWRLITLGPTTPKSLTLVNAHLNRQGILSKHRMAVLDIFRSTFYLLEPAYGVSEMKRTQQMKLRGEIEKIRKRYGRRPGYRPIHAMLLKVGISCSVYLVRKVMKLADFTGLPRSANTQKVTSHLRCAI